MYILREVLGNIPLLFGLLIRYDLMISYFIHWVVICHPLFFDTQNILCLVALIGGQPPQADFCVLFACSSHLPGIHILFLPQMDVPD